MKQEFILKRSPLHKIVLYETAFEIINLQYKDETGVFEYAKLKRIAFKEPSTDYLATLLTNILELVFGGIDKIYKNRERLEIDYAGETKTFILTNFDKVEVLKAIGAIASKIKQ